jgi:hypothetical protein
MKNPKRPQAIVYIDLQPNETQFIEISDAHRILAYLFAEEASRVGEVVRKKLEIMKHNGEVYDYKRGYQLKNIACLWIIIFAVSEDQVVEFDRYTKLHLTQNTFESTNYDSKNKKHRFILQGIPSNYGVEEVMNYMDNNTFVATPLPAEGDVDVYVLTLAQ